MGKKEQNLAFVNSLCIYLLLVQLYSDLRGPPVPVVHRPRTTKHCGPPRPTRHSCHESLSTSKIRDRV